MERYNFKHLYSRIYDEYRSDKPRRMNVDDYINAFAPVRLLYLLIKERESLGDPRFSNVTPLISVHIKGENSKTGHIFEDDMDDPILTDKAMTDLDSTEIEFNEINDKIDFAVKEIERIRGKFIIDYDNNHRSIDLIVTADRETDYKFNLVVNSTYMTSDEQWRTISSFEIKTTDELYRIESTFDTIFFEDRRKEMPILKGNDITLSPDTKEKYYCLEDKFDYWKHYDPYKDTWPDLEARINRYEYKRPFMLNMLPLAAIKLLIDERIKYGDPRFGHFSVNMAVKPEYEQETEIDEEYLMPFLDDLINGREETTIDDIDFFTSKIERFVCWFCITYPDYNSDDDKEINFTYSYGDYKHDLSCIEAILRINDDIKQNARYYMSGMNIRSAVSFFNTIFFEHIDAKALEETENK